MSSFTAFGIVARRRAVKKLDIFEFASGLMAETSTANFVGSEPSQAAVGGELLHEGPQNLRHGCKCAQTVRLSICQKE